MVSYQSLLDSGLGLFDLIQICAILQNMKLHNNSETLMLFTTMSMDPRYSTMALFNVGDNKIRIASGKIFTRAAAVWLSAVLHIPRDQAEQERLFDNTTSNTD